MGRGKEADPRGGRPAIPAQLSVADIGEDLADPGLEPRWIAKSGKLLPCSDEGARQRFLGSIVVAQDAIARPSSRSPTADTIWSNAA